eukprot:CAMPEP_0197596210 /NCGR_PEP_ID=MMETSP1326-20131121/24570_1 /TAXON_ID=1155430 /ORGANISM="Genus nov. species nov., Strain RCC2288" /LENGTH=451 /DNA_ID=CAMNT_0043162673 /DNA_START=49 /DNA_END=1401 /DNA_ORIENTATION=+
MQALLQASVAPTVTAPRAGGRGAGGAARQVAAPVAASACGRSRRLRIDVSTCAASAASRSQHLPLSASSSSPCRAQRTARRGSSATTRASAEDKDAASGGGEASGDDENKASGDDETDASKSSNDSASSSSSSPSSSSPPSSSKEGDAAAAAAPKKKKVPASSSDDMDAVAPALEVDWREFRAKLISQEAVEAGTAVPLTAAQSDELVLSASGENLELLRAQNPKLAAGKPWAHTIAAPEKGCLLLAAEDEFKLGQQYFHQSVILLLEQNEKGSMGVILNRPTTYNMGYVSGDNKGPFAKNALYFGGDVGDGTVSFLHGCEQIKGSAEVLPGVFLGGYDSACELVATGDAVPAEFKFFARYCGWAPGQLEAECSRGVWYPVACSKELALKQVIQLPKPLWREVLELCGGEAAAASLRAYSTTAEGAEEQEVIPEPELYEKVEEEEQQEEEQ